MIIISLIYQFQTKQYKSLTYMYDVELYHNGASQITIQHCQKEKLVSKNLSNINNNIFNNI